MPKRKPAFMLGAVPLVLLLTAAGLLYEFGWCNRITLVKPASFFSAFRVNGGRVYILCHVTLHNTYHTAKTVKLTAMLPEDVKGGLLKSPQLPAVDRDGKVLNFSLPPCSKTELDVTFLGSYGGKTIKQNRALPKIRVTVLNP